MGLISYSVALIVTLATVTKWSIALWPYSGKGKPPLYGDYEAQRHWMEITVNLPIHQWYENNTDNDLLYWGLDYPPLTAYHSFLCGKVAEWFNSTWIELGKSRGVESLQHKFFMRGTVLAADLLVYVPAVIASTFIRQKLTSSYKLLICATTLLYPGLMLIDHGHFQYNCVSLGLFLWAVVAIAARRELIGSALFCLALNYKQMELFHAAPFFFYLLGKIINSKSEWRIYKLLKVVLVVLATFCLCWLPFLYHKQGLAQVVARIFPFERGLYEDKVANIWCSLSVLIKLRDLVPTASLLQLCFASTAVALLPSSLDLLFRSSIRTFKFALLNSALVFFLLSFQVHEKAILIPAISACLLVEESPLMIVWFLIISSFSLLHLLYKDGQMVAFSAILIIYVVLMFRSHEPFSQPYLTQRPLLRFFAIITIFSSLIGCLVLGVAYFAMDPPESLPDLYPLLISVYCCAHFVLFLLYFHYLQFSTWTFWNKLKKMTSGIKGSKAKKKD